jgi:AcrR family transcriptional regulator
VSPRAPGRPPGSSRRREAILAAARESFAARGYERTTIRGIASAAGVDPALVHHYHGSKEELFVRAVSLPISPGEVLEELLSSGTERLGEEVVRFFLRTWDAEPRRGVLVALLRAAASNERAAGLLRDLLARDVVDGVSRALGRPDAPLRATLAASHLVGMAVARYIVRVEPIASASHDTLAAAIGPSVERSLTGELVTG